jgi:hypothetical protein
VEPVSTLIVRDVMDKYSLEDVLVLLTSDVALTEVAVLLLQPDLQLEETVEETVEVPPHQPLEVATLEASQPLSLPMVTPTEEETLKFFTF